MYKALLCTFLTLACFSVPALAGDEERSFGPSWAGSFTWRTVGPGSMGGRIVDLAVIESDPNTYYVGTASGGLFKTVNNGTTFTPVFDHQSTISIGDICVAPSNPEIVWVGTGEHNGRNSVSWGDGVYKSVDGGKTWKHMGLKESFQIGRMAIDPRDPDVVYVGALGRLWGPNEERGLYKTTDGGDSWEKALWVDERTGCIDVALCPDDPDTLLAAMYERERDAFDGGNPAKRWGPGSGLYKSTDGGRTWKRLTEGLPDLQLGRIGFAYSRSNPRNVYAVVETEKIGTAPPGSVQPAFMGIQGTDGEGGARLTNVTQDGPSEKAGLTTGDIVVAVDDKPVRSYSDLVSQIRAHSAGDKVTVKVKRGEEIIDHELTFGKRGTGSSSGRPFGTRLGGQQPNIQEKQGDDGASTGGVFKSTDGGETWSRINSLNPRPFYYSQIRVDPSDEKHIYVLGISLYHSKDGGETFRSDAGRGVHADHHAMWIDPRDGRHIVLGCDGGLYETRDRTQHWEFVNNLPIGQFYHATVGPRRLYRIYGGLQDNGSWGGPSATRGRTGPTDDDWIPIGGGDGFVCQVDPEEPDLVYYESQYGRIGWVNLRTSERGRLRPPQIGKRHVGMQTRDAEGGAQIAAVDGGGPAERAGLKANDLVAMIDKKPVSSKADLMDVIRAHKAGDKLTVEVVRGDEVIEAELTLEDQRHRFSWKTPFLLSHHNSRIFYCAGNYVLRSLDRGSRLRIISPDITRTTRGTATALAESPLDPDVLYVGTDDGYLWLTRDGGHVWQNITDDITGLPGPRRVSSIETSRFEEGRVYVAFDGHYYDDDAPYVFVSEDFGATWKTLRANLPDHSTRVLREDLENADLLFLGTEFGAWVSVDRGKDWIRLNNNMPSVAVHEFAIHASAGEVVAATHGRGLWILDVTPLRQINSEVLAAKAHLFAPKPAVLWSGTVSKRLYGHKRYVGENAARGAVLNYSLAEKAEKVSLRILDAGGKTVRQLPAKNDGGMHRVVWDLRWGRSGNRRPAAGAGETRRRSPAPRSGRPAEAGKYRVVLSVDGEEFTAALQVDSDPEYPSALTFLEMEEEEEQRGLEKRRVD